MSKNKTINVHELQAKISQVLDNAEKGDIYEVMRYSKPVAVVLSYEDYLSLRGECKRCINDIRTVLRLQASNTKELHPSARKYEKEKRGK